MAITQVIKDAVLQVLAVRYEQAFTEKDFQINQTKPEFEGDYTVVLFSLIKSLRKSPEQLGKEMGEHLLQANPQLFTGFNVIKGFLNLHVADNFWVDVLQDNFRNPDFGKAQGKGEKVMVEYSSPNTNKPLHLGHLRNNFLGWSLAEILKASGYDTVKTCIVNDRGIHICKSMIAWQMFANGATPDSTNMKGDHFVGDYYVKFNDEYKKQVKELVAGGMTEAEAEKEAPIMKATQAMLLSWENGDSDVMQLWRAMNSWVYRGFAETYQRIGSDFDKTYYESETYLQGKEYVQEGLEKGMFFRKEDGSVWVDLTEEGLDQKLVLRSDGTSVYITQDIGLAKIKSEEFQPDKSIYVVGDEQNYHMKVLKLICQKLGIPHSEGIHHLSYGMVELPTGKMKSREGTVVDADDLVDEMIKMAETQSKEHGKSEGFSDDELQKLYEMIGLGGLKFFLLKVDPKKKMIFNPEESIDLHGYTATFIQYSHARIKSVLRKGQPDGAAVTTSGSLLPLEKELLIALEQYPEVIASAANEHNPSSIANYAFSLAKIFNSFFTEHSILNAETPGKKELRLKICVMTGNVISSAMHLLGIRVPERM
jgi:arginyl-tRNA synthetase